MRTEKINPALLGFDFDGVIADTAESFIRLARDEYDLTGLEKEDITNFEVEQCLDLDKTAVEAIFTRILMDSVGSGLKPMHGAVEVIGELTEQTEVTVITARPYDAPVHDWLDTVFPTPIRSRIHIVAMGAHDDKARHIHDQGLRYFIDDRAETCVQLSRSGIQPFVFDQPWNRNRHQLPVVSSWQEIRTLCL